jgi:hypothetical protein
VTVTRHRQSRVLSMLTLTHRLTQFIKHNQTQDPARTSCGLSTV